MKPSGPNALTECREKTASLISSSLNGAEALPVKVEMPSRFGAEDAFEVRKEQLLLVFLGDSGA
jgi:hypothetical protein